LIVPVALLALLLVAIEAILRLLRALCADDPELLLVGVVPVLQRDDQA